MTGSHYLSRKEAAVYLGVSEKALATHIHGDGPKFYKFFGKVAYKVADLENWARQQEVRQRY